MGVPKRLTEMQKRFAEYLVFNEGRTTGSDAAIAAGYSEKRARVEASELQNPRLSPLVVQYIGALREEKLKKYEVTYDKHVAELGKIREEALKKGAFSAATNAEKNRGMAAGLYIDRKIIKTGKLEELSEEELEAKMKKILDDYAPILNAKVVDALPEEIIESSSQSVPKESES
jgi:phage terminase small subunit